MRKNNGIIIVVALSITKKTSIISRLRQIRYLNYTKVTIAKQAVNILPSA